MAVYIWTAAMGVIGLAALCSFCYSIFRDMKLRKKINRPFWTMLVNWCLMLISIGAFSMMVYFFFNIKEQLIQFG